MTKVSARLLGVLTALAMSLSIVSGNPAWAEETLDNYIEVSKQTIDFGAVMQIDLGTVEAKYVTVFNETDSTDSPTSMNITADSNDYFVVKLSSPTSVASPDTGVVFDIWPRSTLSTGTYEVPIVFTCTTETESVQKSITAKIVVVDNLPDAADIAVSPESVEFKVMEGYDSDAEAQTLTFTNNSAGAVEITDIFNYGKMFQYDIERVSSSPVIPAGGTVEFRIKPKSGYETLGVTMVEDSIVQFRVKDANENMSAKLVPVRMTLYEYEDTFSGLAITPDTADFGKKRVGYQALEEKTFDISIGDGKFAIIRKDEWPHSENYTIRLWQGSLEYQSSNFTVSPGNNSKITIAPKQGLPPAEYDETIEVDFYDWLGKKTTKTINLKFTVLAKLPAPHITFPTASDITYGQTLADSALTGGSTEYGTFAWDDASIVPGAGTASYGMTFTPSAETEQNYEPIADANKKQNVSVTVAKATPEMTLDTTKNINKLTLTAVVKKVGKGDTPSGDVAFKYSVDNGATWEDINGMSSYEPDADGNLVVAVSNWDFSVLEQKDTLISAEYSGDSNYKSKTITKEDFDSTLPPKHKVTFDLDGGTLLYYSTEREVYEGEPVYRPSPDPTKSGHNFEGWYADSEYQTPYTFGEAIMQATTIFAKFVKATYSLNSDVTPARGGTVTFSKDKALAGDEVTFKLALKDGYALKGMSCVDSNGEVVSIVPLNTVVDEWKFVMPEGDVTVRVTLGVPPKISLDYGEYTFEPEQVGYEVTGWLLVERVNNVGTVPVTISLDNDSDFGCWMLPDLGTTIQPGEIARMYCRQPRNLPVGTHTGEITITATSTEDSTLSVSRPFTMNFTVTEHKPDSIKIDDTNLTDLAYGDGPVTLSLRDPGKGSGAVTWTSSDSSVISIDGTTATITGMGTATITATKADDGTYEGATDSIEVTVKKPAPNMYYWITKKGDTATLTAIVMKSDGKPAPTGTVTFNYVSGDVTYTTDADGNLVAQITGWDYSVMGGNPGHFHAYYSGDDNYGEASAETDFDPNGLSYWTVHWNLNGGTGHSGGAQPDDMEVPDGAKEQIPSLEEIDFWVTPPVAGDEFLGVEIDGVTYKPGDMYEVKSDITVNVLWKSMLRTVVWLDGDGSELDRATYMDGKPVPTTDKIPTKAEDADYTYTFDKWDDGTVDGATITYKPVFTATAKPVHTVIWLDGDGSELDRATYKEGQAEPSTDKVPSKAEDADYTYTFDAWDSGTVDGLTKTYKPVFTSVAKPVHTVIWLDGDGSELDKATYKEGQAEPSTDKVPTKAEDADYTYTFDKWDDGTVDGLTTTYKPVFTSVAKPVHTVIWLDGDGSELGRATYKDGEPVPTIEAIPVKAEDENYTYIFDKWAVETVEGVTTYTPIFTPVPKPAETPSGEGTPSDTGTSDNTNKPSGSDSPAPVQTVASPLVNTGTTVSVGSVLVLLLAGGLLLAYRRKAA